MDHKVYQILMLAGRVLIGSNTVLADGVRIAPGQWEFTTVTKMPMIPQPRTATETTVFIRESKSGEPRHVPLTLERTG